MIEVQKLYNELGFRVSGELLLQVYQWEYSVDEQVFREQMTTGSFRGKLSIDPMMRKLMEQAEQAGKIMPYYGAGGSSGACVYLFQMDGCECRFQVLHTVTGETCDRVVTVQEPDAFLQLEREPEIQFSILPYVTNEELSHPWTGERNRQLVCKIAGQEYVNLLTWSNWVDELALTPRYSYQFGQVSMGATGFAIKVSDQETGSVIDITDYDSW